MNVHKDFWKKEYKKCLLDTTRMYMMEYYCFHHSLWKGQYNVIRNLYEDTKLLIVSKSRDVGYTSLMAARTACELALNSDEKNDIIFIGFSRQSCRDFYDKVREYIHTMPSELITCSDISTDVNHRYLKVGCSRLIVTTSSKELPFSRDDIHPTYVIYDEPVTKRDNYDIEGDLCLGSWFNDSQHIIIGGCSNHRNEKWFNFVKKNKNSVIKMEYESNPNHKSLFFAFKNLFCDMNTDEFADEFKCEIFHVKKEYL